MTPKDISKLRAADEKARSLAQSEFEAPVALNAGAGTGKTTALVSRIVAWSLGPGWEKARSWLEASEGAGARGSACEHSDRIAARVLGRVVAITFTDAASAEMALRTGKYFAGIARGEEPEGASLPRMKHSAEERKLRAHSLLATLDHLVIRTIHAYCRRLLASYPLEAGLHPDFEVDADGSLRGEIIRDVLLRKLPEAYGEEAESAFLSLAEAGHGPEAIAEVLTLLVDKGVPPRALRVDPFPPEAMERELQSLGHALGRFQEADGGRLRNISGRKDIAMETLAAVEASVSLLETATCDDVEIFADFVETLGELWGTKALGRMGSWAEDDFKKNEGKGLDEAREAVASSAADLHPLLCRLVDLDPLLLDHARRALAPLLEEIYATMRKMGVVTYQGLLQGARDLLVDHPGVLNHVRRGMDQLLVDEFQDTDHLQCEIVEKIALEGDSNDRPGLFVVGDPKQSIYGWRRADLASYERFLKRLTEEGGAEHVLSVNFRSVPTILDEVERVIVPNMLRKEGVQPEFQPLVPCEAREGKAGFENGSSKSVEYWVSWLAGAGEPGPAESTTAGQAKELEAWALARDLLSLHEERGVAWQDIGVLFRARGDLETYLTSLRSLNVPYAVEGDKTYYRRREIIEVAALVRCVLDPSDQLALLTLLRSVMIGVPDAAILPLWDHFFPSLMAGLDGSDDRIVEKLVSIIGEVVENLPEDVPGLDRIRGWDKNLIAAVQSIAKSRRSFREEPADRFVEWLRVRFLVEATEAARFLGSYRIANLDRFFRELLDALEEGGGDPQAALRRIRAAVSEEEEGEEGRPKEAVQSAVRVMTIHQAKGLDFKHVYLMQLHRGGAKNKRRANDAEMVGGKYLYKVFGAAVPGFAQIERRREEVESAERARTLYVAMTRAEERLVIAGNWPKPGKSAGQDTHMRLLEGRLPEDIDLPAMMADLGRAADAPYGDVGSARWVFPGLAREENEGARSEARFAKGLPEVERVAADWQTLQDLREQAETRMKRQLSAPASAESHEALRELLASDFHDELGRGDEGPGTRTRGASPDKAGRIAMTAGTVVHRVLEMLDLTGDPGLHLEKLRALLPNMLTSLAPEDVREDARVRAMELLDRLAAGPLLERLQAIGPHLISRESPILLPPADETGAVASVVGAVDFIYRDPETQALVVADFKTDAVESEAELSARAEAYVRQGEVYVRGVKEALDLSEEPRFELWFLHAGRIVSLPVTSA